MANEGGARASNNGRNAQNMIRELLLIKGWTSVPYVHTLEALLHSKQTLFPVPGQFVEQCEVPLIAPYHRGSDRIAMLDFVCLTKLESVVLLSIKSQHSSGTAEQKLEYEIQQLIATEQPAAMFVYGPLRGRDAPSGWTTNVLGEIWERAQHWGSNRVLLFRHVEKLTRWIEAGMPTAGRGKTNASVFAEFCDREP